MTVKDLIVELQKLNPDIIVCGQSETATWELAPDEVVVEPIFVDGILR